MVGTVQFDAEVIQRIKDLLLEDKGSIVIERILQEEVKDPKSPIYQMDIPGYGGIERSIKPKLKERAFIKAHKSSKKEGVTGFTEKELKTLEERGYPKKVKEQDYLDMQEHIKKNPNTTRADIAKKWGVADTYVYTVEDTYSGKHGKLNWKVLWGKGADQLPYVTENGEKILKAMKENPALTTGTKIRNHPDVKLTVKQFNSAMSALKNNKVNPVTDKPRFDISDDLVKKIKRIKGGTITTVEDTLVKKKILNKQQVKNIFTKPRIAVREFFEKGKGKGTAFEHAFPRTLINKKIGNKFLFNKDIRNALEVTGTRTSPYLNFTKMRTDTLQRTLVNQFLADEITLAEYNKGINKLRKQFRDVTGGYEIGYIQFDKNKNPTPITKFKKVSLPTGEWGPGTSQKITPFENAKYTANLLRNYLKNPNDPLFNRLRDSGMDISKISSDTVKEYDALARDYMKAKPYLYNTKKFMDFADIEMKKPNPNSVVRALLKKPGSVKPSDSLELGLQRLQKQWPRIQEQVKKNLISQAEKGGPICSIFGMKSGGVAGGGCVEQMEFAFDNAPEQTLNDIAKVNDPKLKSFAQRALSLFPKLGTPGKIAAGAVAGAAAIGALTYNKELGEFVNPLNDDKASQATVTEWIKDNPVKTVAGTSIGFSAQEIPGAYKKARALGRGRTRSALGITGALKPVLTTFGTPAMTALFEVPFAAKRLEEGDTMTEVLTDPFGPALGLTFMEPLSRGAGVIRDAPKRTWGQAGRGYFDLSNVGKARPGMTSKILRMGLSPRMIAGASRFLGLPGLALSLGLTGYDAYKNYQNQEGMLYNFFNKDE